MSKGLTSSPALDVRRLLAACSVALPLVLAASCRGILGIEDLPRDFPDGAPPGSGQDAAGDAFDSEPDRDRAWASWPVPADVAPRYEVQGAVVRDAVSGLVWQRASGAPVGWRDAERYCDELDVDGNDDWRLPTRIETISVMDSRRRSRKSVLTHFLDPAEVCFWTVSSEPNRVLHWMVATYRGDVGIGSDDLRPCAARCVQGPPYDVSKNRPPRYVVEDGVVRDPGTRLEWQAHVPENAGRLVSLASAEATCSELRLLGRTDWRLPTVKELSTLIDERRSLPALDPRVEGASDAYWSSTRHEPLDGRDAAAGGLAWRVSFTDGTVLRSDDDFVFAAGIALVRCVRSY